MELQEKTMVADTLAGINGELIRYAEMIAQSENKELKQTLKQFRNACEQSQEEQSGKGEVLLCACQQGYGGRGSACEKPVYSGDFVRDIPGKCCSGRNFLNRRASKPWLESSGFGSPFAAGIFRPP